jgi:hypothetical protein
MFASEIEIIFKGKLVTDSLELSKFHNFRDAFNILKYYNIIIDENKKVIHMIEKGVLDTYY